MSLAEKRLFLLDMDGTIYLSETLFDGTLEFLRYVRAIGGRYLFLTNNSSRGTDAYIAKMARLGIEAFPDDFLTSADATIRYLRGRYLPDTVYYVCGTESLKNQLRLAGLRVAETLRDDCAVVLLGYDTELTYEKLERACTYIRNGAVFLATHLDINCPTKDGFIPDCGAICAAISLSTGKEPKYVGKPFKETVDMVLELTGAKREEVSFVGDRIYTDVKTGVANGAHGILVLTGETKPEDIPKSDVVPDAVFTGLKEMGELLGEK